MQLFAEKESEPQGSEATDPGRGCRGVFALLDGCPFAHPNFPNEN